MTLNPTHLFLLLAGVISAGQAFAADRLFVKIEDLVPSADEAFHGSDIEAIELSTPNGLARYYAGAIVSAHVPLRVTEGETEATNLLGAPVLLVPGGPYVHSLNGGSVVVEISSAGQTIGNDWLLSVYEVDGTQYEAGSPDPYRVSVADTAEGPWRDLGVGAGISRFPLTGATAALADATLQELREIVLREDGDKRLPDFLDGIIGGETARISQVQDMQQIEAELKAQHSYYQGKSHHVLDHGMPDNGSLLASRRVITALLERHSQLSGA